MIVFGSTDVGVSRVMNQDFLYFSSEPVGELKNLFLVADGMGGHNAGDYASRFVVENLIVYMKLISDQPIITKLRDGIAKVNTELYFNASRNPALQGTGTTLVAATVDDDTLYVANVGDSRLYIFRGGQLIQITRDHSYVEEMAARGVIEKNSDEYWKKKNIITRAVGTEAKVNVDIFDEQLMPGDLILMCSDGLSNMLSEAGICSCLISAGSLKQKVEQLIDSANANGGKDNITVILVDPQIREVKEC